MPRQALKAILQALVEHIEVLLCPESRRTRGSPQQRDNRLIGLGAEHRARHQPGERQRRSAESKQLRPQGHGERGRPGGATRSRAVERCPRKLMDLGPTLKKVDLLGPQLINERSERGNGVVRGQQRVEPLERALGGAIGLGELSADKLACTRTI